MLSVPEAQRRTAVILKSSLIKHGSALRRAKGKQLLLPRYSRIEVSLLNERLGLNALANCKFSHVPVVLPASWYGWFTDCELRRNHGSSRKIYQKYDFFLFTLSRRIPGVRMVISMPGKGIEEVDSLIPRLLSNPDVLCYRRSFTPASCRPSWHPFRFFCIR